MLRLIGVELFKLKKRWLVYGLLIALLIFSVIPIVTAYTSYQSFVDNESTTTPVTVTHTTDEGQSSVVIIDGTVNGISDNLKESFTLPGAIENLFYNLSGMGPILVIVLAASAIGSEYRWGTIRQMLIKGTGRAEYLGSKLTGIAIVIIAGVLIALLAAFITSLITTALAGDGISWDFMSAGYIGYLFASLGRTLLILGVYFAIAALFSTWLRSVTAGMSLGIVFIFADSIIYALFSASTGWLAEVAPYTVTYNVNELTSLYAFGAEDPTPWLKPTLILLAYCLVSLSAGFYAFRRQDISA